MLYRSRLNASTQINTKLLVVQIRRNYREKNNAVDLSGSYSYFIMFLQPFNNRHKR